MCCEVRNQQCFYLGKSIFANIILFSFLQQSIKILNCLQCFLFLTVICEIFPFKLIIRRIFRRLCRVWEKVTSFYYEWKKTFWKRLWGNCFLFQFSQEKDFFRFLFGFAFVKKVSQFYKKPFLKERNFPLVIISYFTLKHELCNQRLSWSIYFYLLTCAWARARVWSVSWRGVCCFRSNSITSLFYSPADIRNK